MEEAKVERRSDGDTSIALASGGSTSATRGARRPRGDGAGTGGTGLLQQGSASACSRSDRLESSGATKLASIGLVSTAGERIVLVKGEGELVFGRAHRVRAESAASCVVADAQACLAVHQATDLAEQLAIVLGADGVGDGAGGSAYHAGAELGVGDRWERVGSGSPFPVHGRARGGGGVRWVVGIGLHARGSCLGNLRRQTAEVTEGADGVAVDSNEAYQGEIGSVKDRYDARPMIGQGEEGGSVGLEG
jgi:hypothetical protein